MAKNSKQPKEQLTIYIPQETLAWIRARAGVEGISQSQVVVDAVDERRDRLENGQDEVEMVVRQVIKTQAKRRGD